MSKNKDGITPETLSARVTVAFPDVPEYDTDLYFVFSNADSPST